jgi:hypothetical protein
MKEKKRMRASMGSPERKRGFEHMIAVRIILKCI